MTDSINLQDQPLFTPLSSNGLSVMKEILHIDSYKKDDTLVSIGSQSEYEYAIFDGIVRSYVENPEGQFMNFLSVYGPGDYGIATLDSLTGECEVKLSEGTHQFVWLEYTP